MEATPLVLTIWPETVIPRDVSGEAAESVAKSMKVSPGIPVTGMENEPSAAAFTGARLWPVRMFVTVILIGVSGSLTAPAVPMTVSALMVLEREILALVTAGAAALTSIWLAASLSIVASDSTGSAETRFALRRRRASKRRMPE